MICDHPRCKNVPMRAPRLVVPAVTWMVPGHTAIKVMTVMHFCEVHKGGITAADLLRPDMKRRCEYVGRTRRPLGFKCDFEGAFIEHVLITTPEYREWMARIDIAKLVREAA